MLNDDSRKEWERYIYVPESISPDKNKEIICWVMPVYENVKRDSWWGFQNLGNRLAREFSDDNLWIMKPHNDRLGWPHSHHWMYCSMNIWEAVAERKCDWFFHLEDDAIVEPDIYHRLREVADPETAPVVSALAYCRNSPYLPGVTVFNADGKEEQWTVAPNGVHRVRCAPLCATLIHRSVFQKIEHPPFHIRPLLETSPMEVWGCARWFMLRCEKAGIPIYCHCDVNVGHVVAPAIVDRRISEMINSNG